MKYVPRSLQKNPEKNVADNHNVERKNPVTEILQLFAQCLGLFLAAYVILGVAADWVVMNLSAEQEEMLVSQEWLNTSFSATDDHKESQEMLENILETLVAELPSEASQRTYTIRIHDTQQINAVALPGGHIVMFSGLVHKVEDTQIPEDATAFVIAHELGHFVHRDHLKGLGRSLVGATMATTCLGQENPLSTLFLKSLQMTEMQFSRSQESEADQFAIELMQQSGYDLEGAEAFMTMLLNEQTAMEKLDESLTFFATHPATSERLKTLKNLAGH